MATQPPGTETILVVDDDAEMLSFVGDALRMYGYTVLQTTDPREARRWARQHSGPIHLLVSDVVMPLMHGRELAADLRAIRPGLKVMFMSGASPSEVADHGIGTQSENILQGVTLNKSVPDLDIHGCQAYSVF